MSANKKTIISLTKRVLFYILSVLNYCFPKNKKHVFFCDNTTVRDNQYVLLNYMVKSKLYDSYRIYLYTEDIDWINEDILSHVFIVNGKVQGILRRLNAKYVFFAFGTNFMSCCSPDRQTVVDLWHGFGLKKIGYEANNKLVIPIEKCFNKVVSPSPLYNEMIIKSFHCKKDAIIINGTPKIDELFTHTNTLSSFGIDKKHFKKIVFFLPTYRNSSRVGIRNHSYDFPLIDENNIDLINDFMRMKQVCLVVKLHHTAQRDNVIPITKCKYSNIFFLSNADFNKTDVHFYNSLGIADALITDYSSVYQDYLVLNRSIGFVVDDYEEYERIRGFNFPNIFGLMPGMKIYNTVDFIKFIDDIVCEIDPFQTERESLSGTINLYSGNNNCKTLLQYLGIVH